MPWSIVEPPGSEIVEVIYSGTIPPPELAAVVKQLLDRLEKKERVRMLTDLTTLVGGHSIVDLYVLVDEIHRRGLAGRYREAIILPKAAATAEMAGFWETACTNRGIEVRLFTDRAKAMAWLVDESGAD